MLLLLLLLLMLHYIIIIIIIIIIVQLSKFRALLHYFVISYLSWLSDAVDILEKRS
jgi:hypothetical protein